MVTLSRFDIWTTTDTAEARSSMQRKWNWLVFYGVALVVLGALALVYVTAATTVSVYAVGICMLLAAAAHIGVSFMSRGWSGRGVMLLAAVVYAVAGVLAIGNPLLAAQALTLWLACMLILAGAMRFWWSLVLRFVAGWGWIAASGVVSVLAGIVFLAGWPANAAWLPGMVLAIDLLWQGATTIGFGLALRNLSS